MDTKTVILVGERQVTTAQTYVALPEYRGWVMTLRPPAKRRIQEERYHAMIGDIADQCTHPTTGRKLSRESWKRLFVEAMVQILRDEARATGQADPFPDGQGVVMPSLDGLRIVQVEVLTRNFTQKQASLFIEYLDAYGAEHGVVWSVPEATPEP